MIQRPTATARRRLEWALASAAVAASVALSLGPSHWPFGAPPSGRDPSVWQFLLSDRLTLGFVRISVVLLSLFVIASVPALFAAGRWFRSFGAGGLSADEAQNLAAAQQELERLQREVEHLRAERAELLQAMREAPQTDDEEDEA